MLACALCFLAMARPLLAPGYGAFLDQNSGSVQHSYQDLSGLTHAAQADFQQGRFQEAREKLRQALHIAPRDPALWTYLGLTEEQLGNIEAAITDFHRALSVLPRDAQSYFNLGRLYRRKGDRENSLEMYREGLKLVPDDLPANQNYALLLMEAGKFREAIAPLRKMRSLNDSDLSTRAALVECYLKANMPDDGKRELQEFLAAPTASPEEKLKLAKLLVEDKLAEYAQPILTQVLVELPDSADAHATLGVLLMNGNQYEDAENELKLAVHLAPASPEYSMHFAEALLLQKRFPEAIGFLTSVQSVFGNLLEYRFKMAIALYGARQYQAAIAALEELNREHPDLDLIQYYLANSYNETGDLEKALACSRKAIALNPNQSTYYLVLGKVLRQLGDDKTDEAIANLEKALALDPSDSSSKQELALCLERKRDYTKAEQLLRDVLALKPDVLSAHVALSRIYYEDHKKEEGDAEKRIISGLEGNSNE